MTTEYYARIEYTYSSGDAIFSIPFSYIDAQYIKVYVNGEKTSGWLFVNESQIQVTLPKLVTGDVVVFQRETPINEKLVTFTDTSILDEETQNLAQDQVFNAIQEIYDNNEVFKIETNDTLASDKAEIEGIVEANRQELLAQVASDKADADKQIENFKTEVNTTIEQVSEAAAKINELEEAVNTAVTAATTASEKADNAAEEVANAKTEVKNAKEEVVKATEQAHIATAKAEEAKQTVESSLTEIENKTQTEINKIKQTGFYMQDGKLYYTDSEGNPKQFSQGGGLPLASIYLAPFGIDESKNLGRYLNGQVIIQSQFAEFTKEVKSWQTTRPNLFATETNWQAEKTASKLGQCGKFVVDDTAGTIRLPLVININGLTDLANCGVVKDESLPNIKGTVGNWGNAYMGTTQSGAFQLNVDVAGNYGWSTGNGKSNSATFAASSYSSTYQDNAPVQQEAIQYPYVIVVNTGVEEAERPINNYQVNNVYSYGMSQYYKGVMNNNSWLRSAGQWNSGTVYNGVYEWAVGKLNEEVYDPSKFTIVGSPTITSDGVASGFKKGNDLNFPAITVTDDSTIIIHTKIKTTPKSSSSDTMGQCIFGFYKNGTGDESEFFDTYGLYNGTSIVLTYKSKDMDKKSTVIITTVANTEYEYKVEITKNAIKYYLDGELKKQQLNLSFDMSLINNVIGSIGTGSRKSNTASGMKIYLPDFSITVDGEEVFSGSKIVQADGFKKSTDSDITDYDWVVNTEEQTFRLPIKNGQEGVFDNDTLPSGYNLYYYIGDVLENADLVNIARLGEELVDIKSIPHITETYVNGTSWYRVYSDGWCEQGGMVTVTGETANSQVTFVKSYTTVLSVVTTIKSDSAYSSNTGSGNLNSINTRAGGINRVSTTGFYFNYLNKSATSGTGPAQWVARGYIS